MSNVALGSRKTHFEAASSKPLLASFEAFGGFEGFEGQVPMSNVAFGSRKKKHILTRDLRGLRGLTGRP